MKIKRSFKELSVLTGISANRLRYLKDLGAISDAETLTNAEVSFLVEKETGIKKEFDWENYIPKQRRTLSWLVNEIHMDSYRLKKLIEEKRIPHYSVITEEDINYINTHRDEYKQQLLIPLNFIELERQTKIFRLTLRAWWSQGRIRHPQDMNVADIEELKKIYLNREEFGTGENGEGGVHYPSRPKKGRYEVVNKNFNKAKKEIALNKDVR